MAESVSDVMTTEPRTVDVNATLVDVARIMKDEDIGPVIVTEQGSVRGIVTDRDIVIRAVAEGGDPASARVGGICSEELVAVNPQDDVDEAIRLMREHALRRLPVIDDGNPVGIVSLGDLAVEREPRSALAQISAAPPNE